MSTNGDNVENADMAECDGEKVVTMMDVLQEEQDFEDNANAVLGGSDEKNCTYSQGYIKRQAIFACLTCCSEVKCNPEKRAGICLACSLNCHENHEVIELYTKRNFRCDCGNPKFNSHPCQFTPIKTDMNEDNNYNQNFSGLYCICHRPYPDPESTVDDEMIQCIICEDWLHASHLNATVPGSDQYSEMVCEACMEKTEFLYDYTHLAVNIEIQDVDVVGTNSDSKQSNFDLTEKLVNDNADSTEKPNNSMDVDEVQIENKKVTNNGDHCETSISQMEQENKKVKNNGDNFETSTSQMEQENKIVINNVDQFETSTSQMEQENKKVMNNVDNFETSTSQMEQENKKVMNNVNHFETSTSQMEQENKKVINNVDHFETSTSQMEQENKEVTDNGGHLETLTSQMEQSEGQYSDDVTMEAENSSLTAEIQDSTTDITCEETAKPSDDTVQVEEVKTIKSTEVSVEENESLTEVKFQETAKVADDVIASQDIELQVPKEMSETSNNTKKYSEAENTAYAEDKLEQVNEDFGKTEETKYLSDSKDETVEVTENKDVSSNMGLNDLTGKEEDNTDISVVNDDTNKELTDTDITKEVTIDQANSTDTETVSDEVSPVTETTNNEESSVLQTGVNVESSENNIEETHDCPNTTEENKDIKRKLSTEVSIELENNLSKKPRLNDESKCLRRKAAIRVQRAVFWPDNFRQMLCTCTECLSMYNDLKVLFLTDPEDTFLAYEAKGNVDGRATQYEKGLEALSSLDRVQQINALTEYNKMKDKLLDFLKSFKDRKEIVKEEDIKAFFAGMKPKREPDGVYFCR